MSDDKDQSQMDKECGDDKNISPSASPRDKKTKLETVGDTTTTSSTTSRPVYTPLTPAQQLLVAASPPKFINLEDVMRLANGMTDMALAHEIAVGKEFRLEEVEPNPETLEGRVKEVMHKAFWDMLSNSLNEDPPDYTHALVLLKEVKEGLYGLLLPHQQRLRTNIDEALDLTLIEQQAEHGSLDFHRYASFIIDMMASLCAPVRDELVASLRQLMDVVPLYREILKGLRLMKMDLVNFTISQVRPLVQQHSVDYERNKFQTLLEIQKENGVDGLEFTRVWLLRSIDKTTTSQTPCTQSAAVTAACGGESDRESLAAESSASAPTVTTAHINSVLNAAFIEILDWDDDRVFPETLLIDQARLLSLRDDVRWLSLVASVLIVTYSNVGATISGVAQLKNELAQQIGLLTKNVPQSKLSDAMLSVAEQVVVDVGRSLGERGFPALKAEQQQLLKGQISAVVQQDNTVYRLMKDRLLSFISKVLSDPRARDLQLPPGYGAVSDELGSVIGQYLRLVTYNQSVFGPYYSDIITAASTATARHTTGI